MRTVVTSPLLTAEELAKLPPAPETPGYYLFRADRWVPTDGLTYRTWAQTIRVEKAEYNPWLDYGARD